MLLHLIRDLPRLWADFIDRCWWWMLILFGTGMLGTTAANVHAHPGAPAFLLCMFLAANAFVIVSVFARGALYGLLKLVTAILMVGFLVLAPIAAGNIAGDLLGRMLAR